MFSFRKLGLVALLGGAIAGSASALVNPITAIKNFFDFNNNPYEITSDGIYSEKDGSKFTLGKDGLWHDAKGIAMPRKFGIEANKALAMADKKAKEGAKLLGFVPYSTTPTSEKGAYAIWSDNELTRGLFRFTDRRFSEYDHKYMNPAFNSLVNKSLSGSLAELLTDRTAIENLEASKRNSEANIANLESQVKGLSDPTKSSQYKELQGLYRSVLQTNKALDDQIKLYTEKANAIQGLNFPQPQTRQYQKFPLASPADPQSPEEAANASAEDLSGGANPQGAIIVEPLNGEGTTPENAGNANPPVIAEPLPPEMPRALQSRERADSAFANSNYGPKEASVEPPKPSKDFGSLVFDVEGNLDSIGIRIGGRYNFNDIWGIGAGSTWDYMPGRQVLNVVTNQSDKGIYSNLTKVESGLGAGAYLEGKAGYLTVRAGFDYWTRGFLTTEQLMQNSSKLGDANVVSSPLDNFFSFFGEGILEVPIYHDLVKGAIANAKLGFGLDTQRKMYAILGIDFESNRK